MTADPVTYVIDVHRYPQHDLCLVRYLVQADAIEPRVRAAAARAAGRADAPVLCLLGEAVVPMPDSVDDAFREPHYRWLQENAGMSEQDHCITRTSATLTAAARRRGPAWRLRRARPAAS